jgi:ABC-2 type transport system permease protein
MSAARYLHVGRISARQQWAYRGELLMRSISMILFMGIFVALWQTAFTATDQAEFAGYTVIDIVWYLAMTETVALSSSRIFDEISDAVKQGDLVYTLMQPVSYPVMQIVKSLGISAPRLVLNLLTASVVVFAGTGVIGGSLPGFAAFLGMAALSLVLDALIMVLIGLTAFWLEEVRPIFWIYQKLIFTLGGLFLPLEFFPAWLEPVAARLPFRYIANAPARAFVAFSSARVASLVGGQVLYILLIGGLVMLVWHVARRRLVVHGG